MRPLRPLFFTAALTALAATASAQPAIPTRVPLAAIPIAPDKTVSRVETTRVEFQPGQVMPRHKHTVPVICFVTEGAFVYRIGDQLERRAETGTVTYEPPETVIHYFRNASATGPAALNCALLVGKDDHDLNVPLPPE
jgi:quercetin dioxygenase-like cupin family protein